MASPNPHSQRQKTPASRGRDAYDGPHDSAIAQRRRERRAERKLARLLTPRSRRALLLGLVTALLFF